MKRPKLTRDDSGERQGWWLGDRFVPDEPPEAREWYEARRLRAALERIVREIGETVHTWPTQELRKAYNEAFDLLYPDGICDTSSEQGAAGDTTETPQLNCSEKR